MSNSEPRDTLYASAQEEIKRFVFDERVAAVFSDMIARSVPGYANIVGMIGILAREHARSGTRLYDLGCSLGAATAAMAANLPEEGTFELIAVDNAQAMLDRAKVNLADAGLAPVDLVCADLREVEIYNASVVVLNFTLQFLPLDERLALLQRIRAGMVPGGVLLLSEKISGANPREHRLLTDMHHAFKRANGYSDLEISQKRSALENVLLAETLETHRQRLAEAGFSRVDQWFQCFNFVSIIARP